MDSDIIQAIDLFLRFGWPVLLLMTAYFIGTLIEKNHFRDIRKRVIAGLRGIVGGRVKTYEPLLDRARREAVLRMIEDARAQGFDGIFNVRLETSRLANSRGDGEGTAGVEMLAFGTAVRLASRFAPRMERF